MLRELAGRAPIERGLVPRTPANHGEMPTMNNTLTAILQRDGDWYVAYCREVPGANDQGRSKQHARRSLADAIDQMQVTKGQTVDARQPSAPQ